MNRKALAAAALLLGRREETLIHARRSLEEAQRLRFRPEVALAHLQLAELLMAEAVTEAQTHLDTAIDEFRAMKMQPSLERALKHKGLLRA